MTTVLEQHQDGTVAAGILSTGEETWLASPNSSKDDRSSPTEVIMLLIIMYWKHYLQVLSV